MYFLGTALGAPGSGFGTPGSVLERKRRAHVGQACMNCRRRKTKCDGRPPTCLTCQNHQDECTWGDTGDGRKNTTARAQVQALKERVKELERILEIKSEGDDDVQLGANEGVKVDAGGDSGGDMEGLAHSRDRGQTGDEDEMDRVVNTVLHLHVTDTGDEVQYYGPTSAYAHSTQTSQTHRPTSPIDIPPGHTDLTDFRRYLPPFPRLTSIQHQTILDRFFLFFASWNLRVHPYLFFFDLQLGLTLPPDQLLPRYSLYSPFLHNIILAIALKWADEPKLRTDEIRGMFARQADRYLVGELARPVLATVQGLAVKSSYHSTEGDHTTGWAYFGMAERLSHSLGLNVDCAPLVRQGIMSADEMRRRINTFWTIAIQEQTWAVYLGRPHAVQEYSTPYPTIDPVLDQTAFRWDSGQSSGQPGMISSVFVETAKMAVIMQRVMNALYSIKSDLVRLQKDDTINRLGSDLDAWSAQIPASLVINGTSHLNALPHILMLHLAREWITILIHRPYYRPIVSLSGSGGKKGSGPTDEFGNIAVRRCDKAATRILFLLRTYSNRFNLAYCPPTMFNIAFTAGTTHLLAATRPLGSRGSQLSKAKRDDAIGMAEECVRCLRSVAESWTAAGQKADILVGLIQAYRCTPGKIERPVRHVPDRQEQREVVPGADQSRRTGLLQRPSETSISEPYFPNSFGLIQSTSFGSQPSMSTGSSSFRPFSTSGRQHADQVLTPGNYTLDHQSLSSLLTPNGSDSIINCPSQQSALNPSAPAGDEMWYTTPLGWYTPFDSLMGTGQAGGANVGGMPFS